MKKAVLQIFMCGSGPGALARAGVGLRPMPRRERQGRGFSLMEVLLAVFILGIGLIMVATIFPVGADWTRQSTEDSIAQTIAQNAMAIIRDNYAPSSLNGNTAGRLSTIGATVQALPG